MRLTRLTLGGAAAHGAGRQDALSRTTAVYRIHRGMYAGGGSRSAAGGDQPGLVGGDDQLGPVTQAQLGQDPLTWGFAGARAPPHPAAVSAVGRPLPVRRGPLPSPPVAHAA